MRPRFTWIFTVMVIAALCLGVIGGVLLAQQPEETDTPAPLDCSPEGLRIMLIMIEELYPADPFSTDMDSFVSNLYDSSLLNQQLALECGHISTPDDIQYSRDTLQMLANQVAAIQTQRLSADPIEALAQMENLTGDPMRGERLYNTEERTTLGRHFGCVSCHANGVAAPAAEIWDYTVTDRLEQEELEGYTAEQYIVESILHPNAFVATSYVLGTMPPNYGEQMSVQDLADIVAYLHSLSADYVP